MFENLVYEIGIPNAGRSYAYLVHIDSEVLEEYTYQRLEIMVTGTNHILVCAPEYYDGAIDEEVTITLDASGDLKIVSKGGNNDEN